MNTTRTILKAVPSSLASLVRWVSPPPAGVLASITNNSENSVTYSFQESTDGTSWTAKSFTVGEDTVTSFVLASGATHNLKVTSNQQMRLRAIGTDGTVTISFLDRSTADPDEETVLYPYPS